VPEAPAVGIKAASDKEPESLPQENTQAAEIRVKILSIDAPEKIGIRA
jgi:hypothetical protein